MNAREELYADLSRLLAGELTAEEAEKVRALLEKDEEARAVLATMRRIAESAGRMPCPPPAAVATMRTKAAVREAIGVGKPKAFGPVLTLDEVAEYLKVERAMVEEMLDELPAFEFGGKVRLRLDSLEAWIRGRERQYSSGIEAERAARRRIG